MSLTIGDRTIERVAIIDDEAQVREAYGLSVEELNLTPVAFPGPFSDIELFLRDTQSKADAAVCDYHLSKRNFASFDGANVVARYTAKGFPAILCTRDH